jgi:hypothetical protein
MTYCGVPSTGSLKIIGLYAVAGITATNLYALTLGLSVGSNRLQQVTDAAQGPGIDDSRRLDRHVQHRVGRDRDIARDRRARRNSWTARDGGVIQRFGTSEMSAWAGWNSYARFTPDCQTCTVRRAPIRGNIFHRLRSQIR